MWVKFHDELLLGAKRGLPRATRFAYMELSLRARPGRGVLELPLGMTVEDGLRDVLGGDRKELVKAFAQLLAPPVGSTAEPMLRVEGSAGAWKVVVTSWKKWNGVDDSAERVREFRQRQKLEGEQKQESTSPCNALQHVTVTGPVTRLDQKREDQIRSQIPPTPLTGGTDTGAQIRLDGSAEVATPTKPARRRRSPRPPRGASGPQPSDWSPCEAEVAKCIKAGLTESDVAFQAARFTSHHRSKDNEFVDWDAAFRTWMLNELNWAKEKPKGAAPRAPTPVQRAEPGSAWANPDYICDPSRLGPDAEGPAIPS